MMGVYGRRCVLPTCSGTVTYEVRTWHYEVDVLGLIGVFV
jgi:hypothetical protein